MAACAGGAQTVEALIGGATAYGGEGNAALSAPRLIRMDDSYLVAQLEAYLNGTRGTDRDDVYGQQMVPVMGTLTNGQALLDLVAYINNLD